ncbi:MAG TPA: HD-GYP domain-containing protein, partial [Solirubrobacteraceae bacterium]|nr:HD-GYP domain-containing protein [Solirubrobacteraceae bacterium]
MRSVTLVGFFGIALAGMGSFWLARLLSQPIGRLSSSLAGMAASHDVGARLPLTGSSRELDTLTATFNTLMSSVALAEEHTQAAYTGAIRALATALDARDPYTAGHSERVSALSVNIGRHMGLDRDDLEVLRLGALLHDIGKIGVPDAVLHKPGKLDDDEWATMRLHPVIGEQVVASMDTLAHLAPVVRAEHERWDGAGYPDGLAGTEIPLASRIILVADAFHAMTSDRPYRKALPRDVALTELCNNAGSQFCPTVVAAALTALD